MPKIKSLLVKILPSKKQSYDFLLKLVLIFVTAWAAFYVVESKSADINRRWSEQAELSAQKTKFVEDFTLLGQSRVYLAEVFVLNVQTNESRGVLDRSWQNYIDSVSKWNKHNVLNPIFIEEYYGTELKDRYHNNLLPKFSALHDRVLDARAGNVSSDFPQVLESAKNEFFVFSETLMFGER